MQLLSVYLSTVFTCCWR